MIDGNWYKKTIATRKLETHHQRVFKSGIMREELGEIVLKESENGRLKTR